MKTVLGLLIGVPWGVLFCLVLNIRGFLPTFAVGAGLCFLTLILVDCASQVSGSLLLSPPRGSKARSAAGNTEGDTVAPAIPRRVRAPRNGQADPQKRSEA